MFRFLLKNKFVIECIIGNIILAYFLIDFVFTYSDGYICAFLISLYWFYGVWFHADVVPFFEALISKYKKK